MAETYRFRLTFHHSRAGLFRFEKQAETFTLSGGLELTVVARDAQSLSEATRFHMEGRGYENEESARSAGERLRLRLRLMNALLGLGVTVPTKDTTSGGLSDEIKEKMREQSGAIVLDTIVGLAVFPDDERYVEFVTAAHAQVHPGDPTYLFTALSEFWPIEMCLDERSQDALEILGHAVTEASPRTKFLLTYLAAERLVDRSMRSTHAIELIRKFQKEVRMAGLEAREADSLMGALAALHERSFSSALVDLGRSVQTEEKFGDKPLREFLSSCIEIRNKIVHNAAPSSDMDLNKMSDGLRKFCMGLIWTHNQIPHVSVQIPGSVVTIPEGGLSIRVM
jgi:hypothetical protein